MSVCTFSTELKSRWKRFLDVIIKKMYVHNAVYSVLSSHVLFVIWRSTTCDLQLTQLQKLVPDNHNVG